MGKQTNENLQKKSFQELSIISIFDKLLFTEPEKNSLFPVKRLLLIGANPKVQKWKFCDLPTLYKF